MERLKTFEQHDEQQPYIVLVFNIGLRDNTDEEFILKSQPMYDMKKIKKTTRVVAWQNRMLGQFVGKVITIEKHNFDKWEDLDIDWK